MLLKYIDLYNMKLTNKYSLFSSPAYVELCQQLQDVEYDRCFYEIDLFASALSSFDVIVWDKAHNLWTEYDDSNINHKNHWISGTIKGSDIKRMQWNIIKWCKATYIAEECEGTIMHAGQFLERPKKPFKVVLKVPKLTRFLTKIDYPNKGDIMRFMRTLGKIKVQVSITVPEGNYTIHSLGIECQMENSEDVYAILGKLWNRHLIAFPLYKKLLENDELQQFHVSHIKLVYNDGKLTGCKMYLVPNYNIKKLC